MYLQRAVFVVAGDVDIDIQNEKALRSLLSFLLQV